jgi:hypothetical protein
MFWGTNVFCPSWNIVAKLPENKSFCGRIENSIAVSRVTATTEIGDYKEKIVLQKKNIACSNAVALGYSEEMTSI